MKLVVILSLFLVVGCASKSVVKAGNAKSYVLFPKENINHSTGVWARRYSLSLNAEGQDLTLELLNGSDEFVVLEGVSPGRYTVDRVNWKLARRWRSKENDPNFYDLGIDFCVQSNGITVFPYEFNISQKGVGRVYTSYFDMTPVTDEKAEALKETFCAENDCDALTFSGMLCEDEIREQSI